jgi:hypothetical protein
MCEKKADALFSSIGQALTKRSEIVPETIKDPFIMSSSDFF